MQLPSATDRPVFLSDRDFHSTVGAYSQAHIWQALRAARRKLCRRLEGAAQLYDRLAIDIANEGQERGTLDGFFHSK
jgi:hypothetical protein